jgi:hypothetical protein
MAQQNLSSLNANLSPVNRDGFPIVSVFQIRHSLTICYSGPSLPEQQSDDIFRAFFDTEGQGIGI